MEIDCNTVTVAELLEINAEFERQGITGFSGKIKPFVSLSGRTTQAEGLAREVRVWLRNRKKEHRRDSS